MGASGSPQLRVQPASDVVDPTEDETLTAAGERRRKLWRIHAGFVVGISLGIYLDPAAVSFRVPLGSWSATRWSPSVPPASPAAALAATVMTLATIGTYLWLLRRISRCPACEEYVRRMVTSRTCPACRVRLR